MAEANISAAAHPLANPGYGKRSAPGQRTRSHTDFAHLPPREAAVAAYIDRLDDGADISIKTLAKVLPYGQCALGTALRRISRAGHLRRGSEPVDAPDGTQKWITRTWWTRTPRDDAWWEAFRNGDIPEDRARATRSRAFILLAALGRTAPVLSLSAGECHALVPLVDQWLSRGANDQYILQALTAGLPSPVHHPAGLVRSRLTSKLPPERPAPPPPRPPLRMECTQCGIPRPPDLLRDGECGPCRGEPTPDRRPSPLPPARVHARAAEARAAAALHPERDQNFEESARRAPESCTRTA
ncbi:hypothetical protein [Streptomyces sp. TRM49041]|uniref:hypothetical protein n=1 Tax=Streptomyces sp. TRM49041 TaxID=2603216 RepID=UPI0011F06D15|nr:hypothetical protein [Streptomyces sp. TRM49041]